jgi:signal transduction histidine kinase/CheY-like chemotaxis protein
MRKRSRFERKLALLPMFAAVGFAAILAATVVLGAVRHEELTRLRNGYAVSLQASRDLEALLGSFQRALQDAVTARDWSALEEADAHAAAFADAVVNAAANPVPDARIPATISVRFAAYRTLARANVVALLEGETIEQLRAEVEEMTSLFGALRMELAAHTQSERERINAAYTKIDTLNTWATVAVVIVLVTAVSALAALAMSAARDARAALAAVADAASHIAMGDFAGALDFGSRIELQPLATPFNAICDYIEEIASTADGLARGDVEVSVTPRSERDAIGHNLRQAIQDRRAVEKALHQSEEQFRQAQKMEAVGRLAGGVAHDFNNLLTAIHGHVELLGESLPSDHAGQEHVGEVRRSAQRAGALTKQLLAYSRKQVLHPKLVVLSDVVRELSRMMRPMIREDIQLSFQPGTELWPVLIDPTQIEQVLLNLVVNARDAMPAGGRITIRTANAQLDESYALRRPTIKAGDYVALTVEDTGVGMDEATRERIFEPFFTTKQPGEGTGLGLATVYGIVKQSGGDVWVYSEPGIGTTFKIYLPRAERPVVSLVEEVPAPASLPLRGGSEVAMVVEDEPAVRTLILRVLRQRGYTVIEAANGAEALRIANHYHGTIHLLLTDVVMPEIGGRELAETLLARRPSIRVLFMSGYTEDAILQRDVLQAGIQYLEKPFTPTSLSVKVREVLDRPLEELAAASGA